MSHRNGQPKPSASERTLMRFRIRQKIKQKEDKSNVS